MINLYANLRKAKQAEILFIEMTRKDVFTYNTMIKLYAKLGEAKQAENLFEEMKNKGIQPDVVTYNTMINVYAKSKRNIQKAQKILYNDMIKHQRDDFSFNPLRKAYERMFQGEDLENKIQKLNKARLQSESTQGGSSYIGYRGGSRGRGDARDSGREKTRDSYIEGGYRGRGGRQEGRGYSGRGYSGREGGGRVEDREAVAISGREKTRDSSIGGGYRGGLGRQEGRGYSGR
jgi:pentatricopeptide repeat protein